MALLRLYNSNNTEWIASVDETMKRVTRNADWFQTIYHALIVIMAGIAGLVVALVIMLYNAIQSSSCAARS